MQASTHSGEPAVYAGRQHDERGEAMAKGEDRSLGELEALYKKKIRHLSDQRADLASQLGECDEKLKAYEQKLRWVRELITSPEGTAPLPEPAPKRRRRKSPVHDVTLEALRQRSGQWLTVRQVLTAIRKDTGQRVSRQSVNVNLNLLEKASKVRRRPAPPGSGGSRFVFAAV